MIEDKSRSVCIIRCILHLQLEETMEGKEKAEKSVAPLRAKIMRLGNKCRDKVSRQHRLLFEHFTSINEN